MVRRTFWTIFVAIVLELVNAQSNIPMQSLLGGHLSWAIDRNFARDPNSRTVQLTLSTAFTIQDGLECSVTAPFEQVVCKPSANNNICPDPTNGCHEAELFGVLCVAQLIPDASSSGVLRSKYYVSGAQCGHDVNYQSVNVSTNYSRVNVSPSQLGKANRFIVTNHYTQARPTSTVDRNWMPAGKEVLSGKMTHTVRVDQDAVGLVAWLAPRAQYDSLIRSQTGLLLKQCQANMDTCMANPCSEGRKMFLSQDPVQSQTVGITGDYWVSFKSRLLFPFSQPSAGYENTLVSFSPALETFVPLCSVGSGSYSCSKGLSNYFSPVVPFPPFIEIAITPFTRSSSAYRYTFAASSSTYNAPHRAFRMLSYDYDGHQMSQYSPMLKQEMRQNGNKKAGSVDICNARVDCIDNDNPNQGVWPLDPKTTAVTGCKFFFDGDRDATKRQGGLIKLDFNFSLVLSSSTTQNVKHLFTQHVIDTVDFPFLDVDNPDRASCADPVTVKPYVGNLTLQYNTDASSVTRAMVQNIFALYACDAGLKNQPPCFVDSLDATTCGASNYFECNFWEPCSIPLYVKDFTITSTGVQQTTTSSDQKVIVRYAAGFENYPETSLTQTTGVNVFGSASYLYTHTPSGDWLGNRFHFRSAGNISVICFVAYDVDSTESVLSTSDAKTCASTPHCIKLKIVASKPTFVVPTPLTPSYDDNAQLIPNRHDFAACEGWSKDLVLRAADSVTMSISDAEYQQRKFRVFVRDVDVNPSYFDQEVCSSSSAYHFLPDGGQGNWDFFSSQSFSFPPSLATCGQFNGYGAQRTGNNAMQISPEAQETGGSVLFKTVASNYDAKVEYAGGTAELRVRYVPDVSARNGIEVHKECAAPLVEGLFNFSCFQKVVNMDQTICAVAYDNSRQIFGRWVGESDPNGDDLPEWLRDHSNGDMASDVHCWKIKLAAPPLVWVPQQRVRLRVQQESSFFFVAQDPNPEDDIEIFITGNPGLPRGASVDVSRCHWREANTEGLCTTPDLVDLQQYHQQDIRVNFQPSISSRFSWTPGPDTAGMTFKVCASARDNSDTCFNAGPELATARGWFSAPSCVSLEVVPLRVRWEGFFSSLPPSWRFTTYVGCLNEIVISTFDNSDLLAPGEQRYEVSPQLTSSNLSSLEQSRTGNQIVVRWKQNFGEESLTFLLCFGASDPYGIFPSPMSKVCHGGSHALLSCMEDSECGGGICADACVHVLVGKCQYCVEDRSSLTSLVGAMGVDVTWYHLWALNSFQPPARTANVSGILFPPSAPVMTRMTDPDMVEVKQDQRLRIGISFHALPGESVGQLAARFRTTAKILLQMNPELDPLQPFQSSQPQMSNSNPARARLVSKACEGWAQLFEEEEEEERLSSSLQFKAPKQPRPASDLMSAPPDMPPVLPPPRRPSSASPSIIFASTCHPFRLLDGSFQAVAVPPDRAGPDGSLGVVVMGTGKEGMKLLVYDRTKAPVISHDIAVSFKAVPQASNYVSFADSSNTVWSIGLKSGEDV
ncbi:hypothetical protein GUITHDRAFT_149565, partial [Guillardia theta CCMP2712]